MRWEYDDGGRAAAGFRGETGDRVARPLAIAAPMPYRDAYTLINDLAASERPPHRQRRRSSARTGVFKGTTRRVMEHLGWAWHPTMHIGSGCQVHLRASELPSGRLVVALSRHLTAVIDGVIHDTDDPSRGGGRCVYRFWTRPPE
jgi:hypothetical protein